MLAFVVCAAAVAVLASLVGRSVEQLGDRFGPGATGVLQSRARQPARAVHLHLRAARPGWSDVVQAALVGSILANLLLVLGLAFLVGGLRHGTQQLGSERARTIVVLMLLSVTAMAIPSIAHEVHSPAGDHEAPFSVIVSVVLLVLFALSLPFSLRREAGTEADPQSERAALAGARSPSACSRWPGSLAAFVSDWFVVALSRRWTR